MEQNILDIQIPGKVKEMVERVDAIERLEDFCCSVRKIESSQGLTNEEKSALILFSVKICRERDPVARSEMIAELELILLKALVNA